MRSGRVIVIAGPTASGKSALALALAEDLGGVIINADSQQSYRDLPILTARPSAADEARVPHRLFGELEPTVRDSAAAWASRAAAAIAETHAAGRVALVVGGTGLYLRALLNGFPDMPAIPAAVRERAHAKLSELGHAAFHAEVAARDPVLGAKLNTGDTQRLIRAWEVVEATGRPLSAWQADPAQPVLTTPPTTLLLLPPREALTAAIDGRFETMMAAGAVEEVRALLAAGVPRTAPVMRVLGAAPLAAALAGEMSVPAAVERAKTATRQYAKRQSTWFRHQLPAQLTFSAQFSERILPEILTKIREEG